MNQQQHMDNKEKTMMKAFFQRRYAWAWRHRRLLALVVALPLIMFAMFTSGLSVTSVARAQAGNFSSGSNGSDGALVLTTPGTVVFDPVALGLDPEGDHVFHFTIITIGKGVTVTLKPPYLNEPIYWLATGAVQINGVLDLNGENGHPRATILDERYLNMPGAGGYQGGVGRFEYGALGRRALMRDGRGPNGGLSRLGPSASSPGTLGGNEYLVPLFGGSGGGGDGYAAIGGGGGAGGGAILIASSVAIEINGAIRANGGKGGISIDGQVRGGAGSGGAIHLLAPTITGAGNLQTYNPYYNDSSIFGRIRMEAFNRTGFTGATNPPAIWAAPFHVFLPNNLPPPSIRIASVAGHLLPSEPTGRFLTPDATITTTSTVTIILEANYVPLGTQLKLVISTENYNDQDLLSTPLAGTFERSTATVTATIPTGYSQVILYGDWPPQ